MERVALSGYATMDFVARTTEPIRPQGTNIMAVSPEGWPRAGGAPLFAGAALVEGGHEAAPVVVIGADEGGSLFARQAEKHGLGTVGIAMRAASRTPVCFLIDQPDGSYCCFLDRGAMDLADPTAQQRAIVAASDLVVVAAGPPGVTQALLDMLRPEQRLAWIVKADPVSFPPELCDRLWRRAHVVFRNRHERAFHEAASSAPQGQILFETDGDRGVIVSASGHRAVIPASRLAVADATGAGDTFAGGALSVLLRDPDAAELAARTGIEFARRLLERRACFAERPTGDLAGLP